MQCTWYLTVFVLFVQQGWSLAVDLVIGSKGICQRTDKNSVVCIIHLHLWHFTDTLIQGINFSTRPSIFVGVVESIYVKNSISFTALTLCKVLCVLERCNFLWQFNKCGLHHALTALEFRVYCICSIELMCYLQSFHSPSV